MLSRDGRPTPLGDAIAHYGRISKTLHILRLADEPGYRRQIKAQANLQEGRHALARKIFHGRQFHDQVSDSGTAGPRCRCDLQILGIHVQPPRLVSWRPRARRRTARRPSSAAMARTVAFSRSRSAMCIRSSSPR